MDGMGLLAAPSSFVDPATGAPAFGSYEGPLPAVRFPSLGLRDRALRRKRWVYAALATEEVWIALGVVRTGYAATAFGFAYDLVAKRMLVEATALAPMLAARVADDPHAPGALAGLSWRRTHIAFVWTPGGLGITARIGGLALDVTLADASAPAAVSAIAPLEGGLVNATEKRALLTVAGGGRAGDRTLALDRGVGGYDYTHGLLPRHTRWHWGFALGRDASGAPLAFNLVEGFVGRAECAVFADGRVHAMPEPRFLFDADAPSSPWRLEADGIDLAFTPGAVHAQHTSLGIVRSRFVQPVGTFRGVLHVAGRDRRVDDLAGVVEDQDVVW
jgi:hypothetical protein